MAKDKVLDTQLHDTEAVSMNANIFILSRTQTQMELLMLLTWLMGLINKSKTCKFIESGRIFRKK